MKHLFFLLLFINVATYAQKITIVDAATLQPIVNVTAFNITNSKHVISNFDGVLDLTKFRSNETIYLKHLSYQEFEARKKKLVKNKVIKLTAIANDLEAVFLSVSKAKVKRSRIAQEIATFTIQDIQKAAPQTSADLLASIPGIKVQKSQFGGGSPVLRGMEANRVLLVVDGVRMNNAIYRKGHLQNSISVSPNMLERTEIVFGPSSVMYGSDALGGVIHYYTKQPKTNDILSIKPTFLARVSTVNDELTAHAAFEIQSKKIGAFTSISQSKFGDLKMGENRSHGFDDWGLQYDYSNNSTDFYNEYPVVNETPSTQKNMGFSQFDFMQKLVFPLEKKSKLSVNFQYSKSSDIPRFDKLMQRSGGNLKFAEWHYGPQKRLLLSSQLKISPNKKWLKKGTITVAYQNLKESRVQRKFNSLKRFYRNESVDVFSVNGDFEIPIGSKNKRVLTYGTEFSFNDVKSTSVGKTLEVDGFEIINLTEDFVVQTRYPDGGSNYSSSAFYANYRQDISARETLNTGLRFTNTLLNAKWQDETYIVLPDNDIHLNNSAVTATVGYVFKPVKNFQFNAVISSGFRSPNIDDVGKIREKNGFVSVPNIYLKPEFIYNGEIGFLKYLNDKKFNINFTTYYTLLQHYITRDLYELNGNSSINYDGEIVQTIANVNKGNAYIFGGTISLNGKISDFFNAKASATYTKGKAYDTGEPLSSIPPLFGLIEIGYSKNKWDMALNFKFNGQKKHTDYNLFEGIDNVEQTPYNTSTGDYDLGNPSWKTLNYNIQYKLNNKIQLRMHIDNIFDVHFKEFASSISAPGRNFSFSVMSPF